MRHKGKRGQARGKGGKGARLELLRIIGLDRGDVVKYGNFCFRLLPIPPRCQQIMRIQPGAQTIMEGFGITLPIHQRRHGVDAHAVRKPAFGAAPACKRGQAQIIAVAYPRSCPMSATLHKRVVDSR